MKQTTPSEFSLPGARTASRLASWSRQRIDVQAPERLCRTCGEIKPLSVFGRFTSRSRVTGEQRVKFYGPCRDCKKLMDRDRYWSDPAAKRQYAKAHRKVYNAKKARRERLIHRFGKTCMACGATPSRICVDHCHTTGRIRGVLCRDCNLALGQLKEDPNRIEALALYARKHCGGICRDSS